MVYLIAWIDPTDEFDNTCYGILQVTQELIDRLRIYGSIVRATPWAKYVVFEEDCFDFTDSDLEKEFPEIAPDIENLEEGQFFCTTTDLSSDILHNRMDMPKVSCHGVRIYRDSNSTYTFFACNEYSSVEYWFQVSIQHLENARNIQGLISRVLTSDQKEKYLQSPDYCPACQSTNINGVGQCQIDGSGAWQKITCEDCGFSWRDIYSLTGVMEMCS